eukprot:918301_1
MNTLQFLSLALLIISCVSTNIEWNDYALFWCRYIIQRHQTEPYSPNQAITPPTINELNHIFEPFWQTQLNVFDEETSVNLCTLPTIYMWDPVAYFDIDYPICGCGEAQNNSIFRYSNSRQPRYVLSSEYYSAVLLSSEYHCSDKHCTHYTLSSDVNYVEDLPTFIERSFPFRYFNSKSAVHQNVYNYITYSINQGVSLSAVNRVIRDCHHDDFLSRQQSYLLHWIDNGHKVSSLPEYPSFSIPSHRNLIRRVVISDHCSKDRYYNYLWSLKSHNGVLCGDHTFKTCNRLQIKMDSKDWQQPFHALYDVHSASQGLIWMQFCDGADFECIEHLHRNIAAIGPVSVFVTDNCCADSNNLKRIYGDQCTVRQDIWHGLERVRKVMSQKHPLFKLASKELSETLYSDQSRHARPTAAPYIILAKIEKWIIKWSSSNFA